MTVCARSCGCREQMALTLLRLRSPSLTLLRTSVCLCLPSPMPAASLPWHSPVFDVYTAWLFVVTVIFLYWRICCPLEALYCDFFAVIECWIWRISYWWRCLGNQTSCLLQVSFPAETEKLSEGSYVQGNWQGEGALSGIVGRRSRTQEGEKLKHEAYAAPVPAGPSRPHRLFWSREARQSCFCLRPARALSVDQCWPQGGLWCWPRPPALRLRVIPT